VQDEDALPHDAAYDDEMTRYIESLKRIKLKEHRLKLKKTKGKVERLNAKLTNK